MIQIGVTGFETADLSAPAEIGLNNPDHVRFGFGALYGAAVTFSDAAPPATTDNQVGESTRSQFPYVHLSTQRSRHSKTVVYFH